MRTLSRRRVLSSAAIGGAAMTTGAAGLLAVPALAAEESLPVEAPLITPSDLRYGDLVRGTNHRWLGKPDYVRVPITTEQVVSAVRSALAEGKRIAVRSGGHCYENFVANSEIQVVLDLSQMCKVYFDPAMRAFVVEAGATLEQAYQALFKGWRVTLPGGSCPSVGFGGHISGGGYGPLSRLHGLTVDHLYAVEVVTVDAARNVRAVVATREPNDPNRDLWWAHTGGGGGNFGVVTRYWFRSPGATSTDPSRLLPNPPGEVLIADLMFFWSAMTESAFVGLMRNFGAWHETDSAPGSPYNGMFSQLKPQHQAAGTFNLSVQIDATNPVEADRLLTDYLNAVTAGTGLSPLVLERRRLSWLHAVEWPGFTGPRNPNLRFKIKSAYLRRRFTDAQSSTIYRHLTRTDYQHPGALLLITSYGGAINTVPANATVVPQRDSVLKPQFLAAWNDPGDDARHLQWVRQLYRDVFAATGGVPAPSEQTDGCYVNYADVDLGDPALNTSGVPWQTLYYKANYPRLQQVKARWDPRNTFRHAQSIQA